MNNYEGSKFFVELPQDNYGNRAVTNGRPSVVEATSDGDGGFDIIAPTQLGSVHRLYADGWIECDGPARVLDGGSGEREAIITKSFKKEIRALNARIAELSK